MRTQTSTLAFPLNGRVDADAAMDPDDALRVKTALKALGLYRRPEGGVTPYADPDLFQGLRAFQRDHGLREDGVMKPDGPTAERLGKAVAEMSEGNGPRPPRKPTLTAKPQLRPPTPPKGLRRSRGNDIDSNEPMGNQEMRRRIMDFNRRIRREMEDDAIGIIE